MNFLTNFVLKYYHTVYNRIFKKNMTTTLFNISNEIVQFSTPILPWFIVYTLIVRLHINLAILHLIFVHNGTTLMESCSKIIQSYNQKDNRT